jgi:16S rRNA (uracil1498-N3)-methyltransferase
MNIFFQSDLSNKYNNLNEEESRHCMKVLRLREGDVINLIDGKGTFCEAVIKKADPRKCEFEILKTIPEYNKRKFRLTVAIAPTKNIERLEWFLEKATEIGIDQIIPVICRYSERKEMKTERLEKIIISAVKQSQKAYLPKLENVIKFEDFIKKPFQGKKFIAHCYNEEKKSLKDEITQGENVLICIGPEGDFSPSEIDMALNSGFIPVSLGNSRLRTETAGLVACHTANLLNE